MHIQFIYKSKPYKHELLQHCIINNRQNIHTHNWWLEDELAVFKIFLPALKNLKKYIKRDKTYLSKKKKNIFLKATFIGNLVQFSYKTSSQNYVQSFGVFRKGNSGCSFHSVSVSGRA